MLPGLHGRPPIMIAFKHLMHYTPHEGRKQAQASGAGDTPTAVCGICSKPIGQNRRNAQRIPPIP